MPHLSAAGTDLFHVVRGTGPEAILFAHGLFFTHSVWDAQLAALSTQYRCVAWDLRGHGQSGGDAADLDAHVVDAARLVTALGLGPVHLVGASLGGRVALRLAAARPELVRSLTLLGTAIDRAPVGQRRAFRALRVTSRVLGRRWAANRLATQLVGEPWRRLYPHHANALAGGLAGNAPAAWDAAEAVLDRALEGRLPDVPASVLLGEADTSTSPERVLAVHRALPGSRLVRVPAAGHLMSVEAPDAVTAAIRGLLRRLPAAGDDAGRGEPTEEVSASPGWRVQPDAPTL